MAQKIHPLKAIDSSFKNVRIPFARCIFFLFNLFIRPRSDNEDQRRIEYILNNILSGIIALIIFLHITTIKEMIRVGPTYVGISLNILFFILLIFIILLVLSRLGYTTLSSYVLLIIFFLANTYTIYMWGADVPQALLGFALLIVMASILIGVRAGFAVTFIIALTLITINYLQYHSLIPINLYWKKDRGTTKDMIDYSISLGVIAIVSWLSNREIEKSLRRARKSETELKIERDSLEEKVKERTAQLHKTQFEKLRQLYRFAEFGRLSTGLFHDFNNYLTALSLNLEKLKTHQGGDINKVKSYLAQAFDVSVKMENFTHAVQNQLRKQETLKLFSINKEISQVLQLFNYRSKKEQIELSFHYQTELYTFGNNIKFSQAMTNIISNAFDSYFNLPLDKKREVSIKIGTEDDQAMISVQDWGCGISEENLNKIFDPFFTTKDPNRGTGIGLASTQEIIENSFQGKIQAESQEGAGSIFKIIIPIKTNE